MSIKNGDLSCVEFNCERAKEDLIHVSGCANGGVYIRIMNIIKSREVECDALLSEINARLLLKALLAQLEEKGDE